MSESQSRLSPKQCRFCEEYLLDLNPAGAYLRAGYKCKDADVARRAASRLLTNVDIQEQIRKLIQERSQRTAVTADRVLEEIAVIAFSNICDFVSWGSDGVSLKRSEELQAGQTRAIAEINSQKMEGSGVHTKVKLADKIAALRLAAQHTGLLGDLNQAFNILRRYGYAIKQEGTGYWIQDTYTLESDPNLDNLEKDQ